MDVFIYQEKSRKVKGEEEVFLSPIGVLEGFEDEDSALEALLDAEPDFLGVELVIFTQEPQYITPQEPPATKYMFARRNGSGAVVEEDEQPVVEEEPVEEEAPAPATKRRPKTKPAAKSSAKRPPAKKPAAAKRPATRAATRSGGGRKSPFTRNAASAD